MAVTLTKSYSDGFLGSVKFKDEGSYYYYYYAYYTDVSTTRKTVHFKVRTIGATRENSASISRATFNVSLTGYSVSSVTGSFTVYKNWVQADALETSVDVDYNTTTGKWGPVSVSLSMSGGSGTYDDGQSMSTAASLSAVTNTISLPDIDPAPTVEITGVTVQSNGYNGNAVAAISTLQASMSFKYASTATLTVTGVGITKTYTINVTKAASETKTQNIPLTDFVSSSNFTLSLSLAVANNTYTASTSATKAIKGYHLPTYGSSTYTRRCDSSGNADSNGSYGRLYLTWSVTTIDTSNPNTLQSYLVKLNGTTITPSSGSIANGYLNFIFPLAVNVQGNLEVTLTDKIRSNIITSLVVPKQTMPLSLYQSGDSVGVSVGRMATSDGFWCYEEFYLKGQGHTTVYNIGVDSNGVLNVDGNPVAYTSGSQI